MKNPSIKSVLPTKNSYQKELPPPKRCFTEAAAVNSNGTVLSQRPL